MVAIQSFGVGRREAVNLRRNRAFSITTEWVFLALFVGGLAWVPMWIGSNRVMAWGINAILFPGLAALYELSLLVRGTSHPVPIRRIGISAALFGVSATWVLIQNATWVPTGWQHPIWQLASDALGQQIAGSISIDRDLTAHALLRLLTAASTFWLALQLCRDAVRARFLIWSVVVIGAMYAAVGILALGFLPNGRVFAEFGKTKFVTSTFVNQNHYVTFAGIGLIAVIAAILRLYRQQFAQSGDPLRLKLAALIETTGSKSALPLAFAATIITALLLTGSRGGIIGTGLGIFVLFVLNFRGSKQSSRNEGLLLAFAALAVAAVFIGFGDAFLGRLVNGGIYDAGRLPVLRVTMGSILTSPIFGFGYGTFVAAFPMFRDDSLSVFNFWDRAHNTYLEVLQGMGLLFGGMLIACVVILVWNCVKGTRIRRRDATIPAIAVGVSFLVGIHALVDFSLQVQAVTLTYMAVLGVGVAQSRDGSSPSEVSAAAGNARARNPRRAGHTQ